MPIDQLRRDTAVEVAAKPAKMAGTPMRMQQTMSDFLCRHLITDACPLQLDGKSYTGFAGDTLASALFANNVHLRADHLTSPPARHYGCRRRTANALVQVGTVEPNLRQHR